MKFFRSIMLVFSFGFFGFGSSILNFFIVEISKLVLKEKERKIFISKVINKTWRFFINFITFNGLIKVEVKNKEKLDEIKGKVIVSTHPSFIDIVILMSLIPKTTCFTKGKLAKNPFFKNIVESNFITNDTDLEEIKKQTKAFLDDGFNVVVFPMGSRHRKDEFPKIKKGAAAIALNAKKDIVPIRLFSSGDFLFSNQPFYCGGEKRVIFELEVMPDIKYEDFYDENEIIAKKNAVKLIEKSLYNN